MRCPNWIKRILGRFIFIDGRDKCPDCKKYLNANEIIYKGGFLALDEDIHICTQQENQND